jgi:hypothetical protein
MEFALYLTTAIAVSAQVFWLMAWTLWGAPTSNARTVALFGCGVLLVAAILVKWRASVAAGIALCACMVIWFSYSPALVYTLFRLPSIHKLGVFVSAFVVCVVPAFALTVSTVRSAMVVFRTIRRSSTG